MRACGTGSDRGSITSLVDWNSVVEVEQNTVEVVGHMFVAVAEHNVVAAWCRVRQGLYVCSG
jgi:hypothetical protein